jgi:hypothetical protein
VKFHVSDPEEYLGALFPNPNSRPRRRVGEGVDFML